jgi:hydroxymethylbilane synthase
MTFAVRIGTRGSRLALGQARFVASRLEQFAATTTIIEIETAGDQVRDVPLAQIGGEGVFTKEIQRALLDHRVDVAVHSLKDLPTIPVVGLVLAAVPRRGPTEDVLVSQRHRSFDDLPIGAVVATSSLRRRAQLLHHRPDLQIVPIRGNVETRLRRLTEEGLDALILAKAGLERLELESAITEVLDLAWMLPAVGQGALGLECRADDQETLALVRTLNDLATFRSALAERSLLRCLGGGCQVPIGAVTTTEGDRLTLRGVVLDPDGRRRVERRVSGSAHGAEELGRQLAAELLEHGARELLQQFSTQVPDDSP